MRIDEPATYLTLETEDRLDSSSNTPIVFGKLDRKPKASTSLRGIGGLKGAGSLGWLMGILVACQGNPLTSKKPVLVDGSAAAGALAWSFYKKWQSKKSQKKENHPIDYHSGGFSLWAETWASSPEAQDEHSSFLFLQTIVFAARADGHIDEACSAGILDDIERAYPGSDLVFLIDSLLHRSLDVRDLSQRVASPEEAYDVYRLSCFIVEEENEAERLYLKELADALNISEETRAKLAMEIADAKGLKIN